MPRTSSRLQTALFAHYFLLFLTLLAPWHAIGHTTHALGDHNRISGADCHAGSEFHHPDLCEICKSAGQPGFCPVLFRTIVPHTPCGFVGPDAQPQVDDLRPDAASSRAPPAA